MLLRAERHVWTGAELLVETSGNHSLASSPALENPFPPLARTHTHIHSNTLPPLVSLTVSVRLEEACCYTITLANLASGRQAGRPRGITLRLLPSLRKRALFQVFHSTALGSQLHKLFTLLFLGCAGESGGK